MKNLLKLLATLAINTLTSRVTQKPLCRHKVLSQYAAFIDAGYEAEIWHMTNNNPIKAGGFKYHVAVRIKKGDEWLWVNQPRTTFTTTTKQPNGTKLLRQMKFAEVAGWVKMNETGKGE